MVWKIESDTADEITIHDLQEMIEGGLVPKVVDEVFQFNVQGIIRLDPNTRKLKMEFNDNTPL